MNSITTEDSQDNPWTFPVTDSKSKRTKNKVQHKLVRYFDLDASLETKSKQFVPGVGVAKEDLWNDGSKPKKHKKIKRLHYEKPDQCGGIFTTEKKASSQHLQEGELDNVEEKDVETKVYEAVVGPCFKAPSTAWRGRLANIGMKHKTDKLMERTPVAPEKLLYYSRGKGVDVQDIRTKFHSKKFAKHDEVIEKSLEQAARTELLLPEESGYLVADPGEATIQYTQQQIAANADIASATKHFDLQLNQFGPYRMNYNRSGRYLLLGGRKGHVAALDWVTKKLLCEMNVMEEIYDVKWLHVETMFAVAQKNWVHVYDNQGIELHCLKKMNKVLCMEFLPYHFLLASANEDGYLSWLDISIGKFVSTIGTHLGRLNIMAQNPANAVICLGHSKGIVTMWSPTVREPLAKMLCHQHPITAVTVDPKGLYMATSSMDRSVKIWDVRMLKGPLQDYRLRAPVTNLDLSHCGVLGMGMGNIVEIYRDCCTHTAASAYLRHKLTRSIANMQFCPYEDVLGVASAGGFTSLLVPGSGEPNYDALESNPYQTKSQRKEAEVKALLEKIQPEFITLDPSVIGEVDLPSVQEKVEQQLKTLHYKAPAVELEHRKKGKKKGSAKLALSKKIVQEERRKELTKRKKLIADQMFETEEKEAIEPTIPNVLDRFRSKKRIQ